MMTGKMMRGSAPVLLIGLLAACATPAHLQSQGGTGFGTGATGYGAPAAAPYAAPPAYRNLDDVLTHHAGSIRVNHRLGPLGVVMARSDVHDPYRD